LNENFKHSLLSRLRDETYIDVNGMTRKSIVEKLAAWGFEIYEEKTLNIFKSRHAKWNVPNLRGDWSRGLLGVAAKGFDDNYIRVTA